MSRYDDAAIKQMVTQCREAINALPTFPQELNDKGHQAISALDKYIAAKVASCMNSGSAKEFLAAGQKLREMLLRSFPATQVEALITDMNNSITTTLKHSQEVPRASFNPMDAGTGYGGR